MAQISGANFCRLLRTKFSYFRAPGGERLIDPDSTTACYTCLLTQRPVGPDGMPVTFGDLAVVAAAGDAHRAALLLPAAHAIGKRRRDAGVKELRGRLVEP